MDTAFDAAMKVELVFEGGKVDDPQDPGGRTNQGVTQRVYTSWRRNNKLPDRDVFLMTPDERDTIYRDQYATKVKFDDLPPGVNLVMLDGAINSGVVQAVKWLQRALGSAYQGRVDGIMGEHTFAAARAVNDVDGLITAILERRTAFLKALRTWARFGRGWGSRIDQVRKIALAWADGAPHYPATYVENMHKKAPISDAKTIPMTAPPGAVTGVGGTIAAFSATATAWVSQLKAYVAQVAFLPHTSDVSQALDHVAAVVTAGGGIAGLAVAAGGGAWLWWAKRESAKLHGALDTLPASSVTNTGAPLPAGAS